MSKFKVGDRVRVGKEEDDLMYRPEKSSGKQGRIVTVYPQGQYDVLLDVPLSGYENLEWGYDGGELELINDYAINPSMAEKYPKYYKDVSGVGTIDVYAVHDLFGIDDASGAIQHASKKLLLSGVRTGGKSKVDDVREARDTLNRWLEMNGQLKSDDVLSARAQYADEIPPHTINAADQGWIEWNGGECPVCDGCIVETRDRDGTPSEARAGEWDWSHGNLPDDIVRYRIVK